MVFRGMRPARNSSISRVSPNENSPPPMSTSSVTGVASSTFRGCVIALYAARMRQILLALLIAAPASAQNADALWQSLMDGNRAFVAGKVTFDHLADLRRHSADHQNPPFTILACSDSRVPPELIFNRSLDQLFVIRVAGSNTRSPTATPS
ncbi:MAG: hypothetical protein DMF59_09340 [Acidobacteria bacterium]|nr:MAG: hypothetical protein DMF59_09340 [Acidobacteriota bacterium]